MTPETRANSQAIYMPLLTCVHRLTLAGALALIAGGAHAQTGSPPPGHTRSLAVIRTEQPPVIDGRLDDAIWSSAQRATDFWISEYGRAPSEQTEVLVAADDEALYFGFICHDAEPDRIRFTETRRDTGFSFDDHVIVELDPYHNHRLISKFLVNARGTQADVMAGGRAGKIDWRGDWQVAAVRTSQGWMAELMVPVKLLNFKNGTGTFGINFVRYHARTQEWSRWADVTPQSLAEEAGHLVDLDPFSSARASRLAVMQYGTVGMNSSGADGALQRVRAATGLDLRYRASTNATAMLSVIPDFSQVESDVLGLQFDYNEKLRDDHRPFFQEGAGFFGSSLYFHPGRVPDFDIGLKSFGKVGNFQYGVLGARALDSRSDYVANLTREIGPRMNVGVTYVGTEREDFDNRLFAAQAGGRIGQRVSFAANMASTVSEGRPGGDGTHMAFSLGHHTESWHLGVDTDRTHAEFFPANGFIGGDRLGTMGASGYVGYGRSYGDGPLQRFDANVSYTSRETLSSLIQRRDVSVYVGGETRSNIQFSAGMSRGPYRPSTGVGTWATSLNDDRFYTAGVYLNTRSQYFGYGMTYSWGFLGGADYGYLTPSAWVRPLSNLRFSYSYELMESYGLSHQHLLSGTWEITPEQAVSARWLAYGTNYYRVAYRRTVKRGLDIYAVYSTDPIDVDTAAVKLVWTLVPFPRF